MGSTEPLSEIAHDFSPMMIIYKDGTIERLVGNDIVPPSFDPKTNVDSRDVLYLPENTLSARLYIPKNPKDQNRKLPLVVYFHGGGFCVHTAFSSTYNNYLNNLVSEANIIAVSVDYQRAPEIPVPCAHEDSWTALKWVASHVDGDGQEDWLNHYVDFQRLFFAGDSSGAKIAHHMGTTDVKTREWREAMRQFVYPSMIDCDDPLVNPAVGSNLTSLQGCARMLVFKLKESGWKGDVEIVDSQGEQHVFHLRNPDCKNAVSMLKKTAALFSHDKA
ncbi:putative carboxylesterase 13 [Citrus sinensis]|nr:putative carboxylesterase 13 [Citrus sinensis]